MMFIDGVENPYVFGEQRTVLLNRSKIVINLLRNEWDNNAGRFYLAALNRALFVTEPMLAHNIVIQPGVHIVETPLDQLASTINYYIDNEDEREKITEQAHHLVTEDITIDKTLSKILNAIRVQPII
jgi:spore maturation protein CgeB